MEPLCAGINTLCSIIVTNHDHHHTIGDAHMTIIILSIDRYGFSFHAQNTNVSCKDMYTEKKKISILL